MKIKTGQYTGVSSRGINEAIEDALQKADQYAVVEVVETVSSQVGKDKPYYSVLVNTFEISASKL